MKLSNAWKPDVSSFNLRTRIYPGYLLPFLNSVIERPSKASGSKGDSPSLRDHTRSACKSWKNLPLSSTRDRSARRKATIFPFRRQFVFVEKWWRDVIESKVNAKVSLSSRKRDCGDRVEPLVAETRRFEKGLEELEGGFERFRISAGLIVERALEGFSNAAISLPPPLLFVSERLNLGPHSSQGETQSHRFRASQASRLRFRHRRRLSCRDNMLISQPVMLINGRRRDVDLVPLFRPFRIEDECWVEPVYLYVINI